MVGDMIPRIIRLLLVALLGAAFAIVLSFIIPATGGSPLTYKGPLWGLLGGLFLAGVIVYKKRTDAR